MSEFVQTSTHKPGFTFLKFISICCALLLMVTSQWVKAQNQPDFNITQPSALVIDAGNSTGLSGYYDFQIIGSSAHYIAVNPENTNQIYIVYNYSDNQLDPIGSRNIAYTYSNDAGQTWISKIAPLDPGAIKPAFPAITYLPDGNGGGQPLIVGHVNEGDDILSMLYKEGTPGFGDFSNLDTDTTQNVSNPVWPKILASSDGSKAWVMVTENDTANNEISRYKSYLTTYDPKNNTFGSFQGPLKYTDQSDMRGFGFYGMAQSQDRQKVAMYHIDAINDLTLSYSESSDSGKTFPDFTKVTPYPTKVNGDTIGTYVGCDGVYAKNELSLVFSSTEPYFIPEVGWQLDTSATGIWHWSQSGGFSEIATISDMQNLFGGDWTGENMPNNGKPQTNTFPMGYPSIGTDTSGTLHCVFQAARPNKSKDGFNYFTVCYSTSNDGGATWSAPVILEADSNKDFRYPSVAKLNPYGRVYVVYQEDSVPGSGIRDGVAATEAKLVFARISETSGVVIRKSPKAESFELAQNYPNPFNPSTTISYTLKQAGFVSLEVYDVLGRRIQTLVSERQQRGSYQVVFNGTDLSSGVYFMKLSSDGFAAKLRKMMLVK